jgi:pyrimidine-nucleoside phosphorylase
MRMVDLIAAKRDGAEHSTLELAWIIQGMQDGSVPDYQLAAWLMAILWRSMSEREAIDLTMAMVHSGQILDLHTIAPFIVDKHSTGGVGDKTTLVVAPLVAAAGMPLVKLSGRGLGFTGGTLDKLEAIPGFNVSLSTEDLLEQVRQHGIALAGQTADLAPADGRLYALRDVTATVPSLPLIASSIMSKKIASGADAIVLDVKVGRGAFMETLTQARALAMLMMRIGQGLGKRVTSVLADMSQPLGCAVGNALEVAEAIATLKGSGPPDLREHCLTVGAEMLRLAGHITDISAAQAKLSILLDNGSALDKFAEWVTAQHGDARVINNPGMLPQADISADLHSHSSGYVTAIDAREIGLLVGALGAGRERKGDPVDPAVGVVLNVKVGHQVDVGQKLATIYARNGANLKSVKARLMAAFTIGPQRLDPPPTIYEVLRG